MWKSTVQVWILSTRPARRLHNLQALARRAAAEVRLCFKYPLQTSPYGGCQDLVLSLAGRGVLQDGNSMTASQPVASFPTGLNSCWCLNQSTLQSLPNERRRKHHALNTKAEGNLWWESRWIGRLYVKIVKGECSLEDTKVSLSLALRTQIHTWNLSRVHLTTVSSLKDQKLKLGEVLCRQF